MFWRHLVSSFHMFMCGLTVMLIFIVCALSLIVPVVYLGWLGAIISCVIGIVLSATYKCLEEKYG